MKKGSLFIVLLLNFFVAVAQSEISIIPQPVSIEKGDGKFIWNQSTSFRSSGVAEADRVARLFLDEVSAAMGFKTATSSSASKNTISLIINETPEKQLGEEGYSLNVTSDQINIRANKPAGIFYALQTLRQLLPPEIESTAPAGITEWAVPAVAITDYPRFAWRGLMFDVVRHFFTKDQVKQFIDEMVRYKYNVLHLHLTDDQGWRIEIKTLPKLTEVGAWRVEKTGTFGTFSPPGANEPRTYGGFYTHDDIRELVRYAAERFVNILPEIDVPGHSLAAVASYPELTCTPGTYRVNSGEKFMNWYAGGFSALVDNTLCPANEKVYAFLDKVFTEVAQLFPFEYIHMGGDETAKNFWEKNSRIKQLMQRENLKDMHDVQSYFVRRVSKIIESKGKKMIGWDEILEGGLPKNAVVMSWRGMKGGIEAAKMGHEVVMSPSTHTYIDCMQGDAVTESPVYCSIRLSTTYQFDPVPDGVDPALIKGGQANLWTEQIYNMRHAQYMAWPRSFAVAEAVWTPKEKKSWADFVRRIEQHFKRFDAAEKKYSRAMYDPIVKASKDEKGLLKITLAKEIDELDIYYSFDNSPPDRFYPKYTAPLLPPKDAVNLKLVTYRGKNKVGRELILPISELKRRAGIR